MTINDFIYFVYLTTCLGTKVTCQEGGCGSCVVALTKQDLVTSKEKTIAVNSVS